MKFLTLDFETKSLLDLKKVGAHIYAAHPSTKILSFAYRFSTDKPGVVKIWNGKKPELKLQKFNGLIVTHNWAFEYWIMKFLFVEKNLLPESYLDVSRYRCTMATAMRFGLPAKLGRLAERLNTENQKLSEQGAKLINAYSKPYTDRKTKEVKFREINIDDKKLLYEYNKSDVLATEEIYNLLPKLNNDKFEAPIFELDKRMNIQGLCVDKTNLKKLLTAYDKYTKQAEVIADTIAGRQKPSSKNKLGTLTIKSPKFQDWLDTYIPKKLKIENCQAFTLSTLLKELENLEKIQTVDGKRILKNTINALKIRQVLSATSAKKLQAFSDRLSTKKTYKIYNTIQYFGGHTGRWAGRGVQPQNFPRKSSENFLADVKNLQTNSIPVYESMNVIKTLLRQLIIPQKKHKFLIGDFASIEARVLFWLAECETGLNAYRQGVDIYSEFAAKYIFYIPIDQITKHQRALGKISILGLGYGMGIDKFMDFCRTNNIKIDYKLASTVVKTYRDVYSQVPAYWRKCEKFLKGAINSKNIFTTGSVSFKKNKNSVKIILPSGRAMYYPQPRLFDDSIQYIQGSRGVTTIWGAGIVENIVQATSRDIMAVAMLKCNAAGLNPVLTVHDEIVCQVPIKTAKKDLITFQNILETPPTWANDLPVGAECVSTSRYKKI